MTAAVPIQHSFRSFIEPRSGAISRWVAGASSDQRVVFVSHLSDVNLTPNGPSAVHEVFVLTRYAPRDASPVESYSLDRRSTRTEIANLLPPEVTKEEYLGIREVGLSLLVENGEVREAIGRLFRTADQGDFLSRHPRGLGSVFDHAYRWESGLVEPGSQVGTGELETSIYLNGALDLRIHSVFRVEHPAGLTVPPTSRINP